LISINSQRIEDEELYIIKTEKTMKIISHILSMILSGMKPEDIYVELLSITPAFKAVWVMFVAFLSHIMETFTYRPGSTHNQATARLSLCH